MMLCYKFLESNYSYDILYNGSIICKEKKNYVNDFIFNIERNKNLGYIYEIIVENILFKLFKDLKFIVIMKFYIKRILANEIKDFENNFFKYIFQEISPVQLIDKSWKNKSVIDDIQVSKQPKNLSMKLFEYQLKSLSWMKKIESSNNSYILDTKRCMTELIDSSNDDFKDIFFDMFDIYIYIYIVHNFNSSYNFSRYKMVLSSYKADYYYYYFRKTICLQSK